jgi:hypothetical protein
MCPAPVQASAGDRFDENRVGLDHLSFSMVDRQQLEAAVQTLDEHGVPHGEIKTSGKHFRCLFWHSGSRTTFNSS